MTFIENIKQLQEMVITKINVNFITILAGVLMDWKSEREQLILALKEEHKENINNMNNNQLLERKLHHTETCETCQYITKLEGGKQC